MDRPFQSIIFFLLSWQCSCDLAGAVSLVHTPFSMTSKSISTVTTSMDTVPSAPVLPRADSSDSSVGSGTYTFGSSVMILPTNAPATFDISGNISPLLSSISATSTSIQLTSNVVENSGSNSTLPASLLSSTNVSATPTITAGQIVSSTGTSVPGEVRFFQDLRLLGSIFAATLSAQTPAKPSTSATGGHPLNTTKSTDTDSQHDKNSDDNFASPTSATISALTPSGLASTTGPARQPSMPASEMKPNPSSSNYANVSLCGDLSCQDCVSFCPSLNDTYRLDFHGTNAIKTYKIFTLPLGMAMEFSQPVSGGMDVCESRIWQASIDEALIACYKLPLEGLAWCAALRWA